VFGENIEGKKELKFNLDNVILQGAEDSMLTDTYTLSDFLLVVDELSIKKDALKNCKKDRACKESMVEES